MEPHIIKGNIYNDVRGSVSFVNDFNFKNIVRFYIIENSIEHELRAWQGHKLDTKYFYCISGSFQVSYIQIDNWDKPSSNLIIQHEILKKDDSKILCIPPGYANALRSLESGSRLLSFSTLPLNEVKDDDVRYDKNTWSVQ
ncbi:MAG: hypothetical protein LBV71_18915 [Prevotella sp.]|jgi:dTDP-4-dehydrorhamnose 3,5-epimerase|nr:hypothetical protein [Prevotella sp.]